VVWFARVCFVVMASELDLCYFPAHDPTNCAGCIDAMIAIVYALCLSFRLVEASDTLGNWDCTDLT